MEMTRPRAPRKRREGTRRTSAGDKLVSFRNRNSAAAARGRRLTGSVSLFEAFLEARWFPDSSLGVAHPLVVGNIGELFLAFAFGGDNFGGTFGFLRRMLEFELLTVKYIVLVKCGGDLSKCQRDPLQI